MIFNSFLTRYLAFVVFCFLVPILCEIGKRDISFMINFIPVYMMNGLMFVLFFAGVMFWPAYFIHKWLKLRKLNIYLNWLITLVAYFLIFFIYSFVALVLAYV